MLDTARMKTPGKMLRQVSGIDWYALPVRPRTSPDGLFLYAVEASLPKLLGGHNGRVITTQGELDAAFQKLHDVASGFAEVPPLSEWEPWRLDLVWQLVVPNAAAVIDALSGFLYPGIRSPAIHQAGRCVTWRGAGSRFMVQAYAKAAKMRQPGQILRVEVRLCGHELRRLHGRDWRDFGQLYAAYREIVTALPDVPMPGGKRCLVDAVGLIVPTEFHEVLLATMGQSERTKRETRRRFRIAKASLARGLSLKGLLPPDSPPAAVTVEPRSRRRYMQPVKPGTEQP